MTDQTAEQRPGKIAIWFDRWLNVIVSIVLVALVFFTVRSSLWAHRDIFPSWPSLQEWLDSLFQNAGTEFFGALLTFWLIEILVGGRDQRREEKHLDNTMDAFREALDEQERRALVNQLSSRVPGFAAEGVRLLKHRGWYDEMDVFRALQNGGDFSMVDLRGLRIPEDILELKIWEGPFGTLERLDLRWAKLEQADLRGAQLVEVCLLWAQLTRANLREAHLEKIDLRGAQLEGADLVRAHMEEAQVMGAQLAGANLSGTHLEKANLSHAHLEEANLYGAQLKKASLGETRLTGAEMSVVHLEEANLRSAQLEKASLHGAHLEKVSLEGTQLEKAVLTGARLTEADLSQAQLAGADLRWAYLVGAKRLTTGQLEEASTLEGCWLPDGMRLPSRRTFPNDPEPDWQKAFTAWVARGREEGWIHDHDEYGEGYIDVEKIPPRDDEGADA